MRNFYNTFILLKFILTLFFLTPLQGRYELNSRFTNYCNIPPLIRGLWYSWENGRSTTTEINKISISGRGNCISSAVENNVYFTFVFRKNDSGCYTTIKIIARTVNVLDKIESVCRTTLNDGDTFQDTQMITLFSENYTPVNCRSSLQGVWQFAYQNRFRFTGECDNPEAQIKSCHTAGAQFLLTNQKFNITYKECPGMVGSFDAVVEYSCLGDWFVGKNHFFAVANTRESRKDEKYRCFLKNPDDDLYIGASITAECNTLLTVENSPERMHINPIKAEIVWPSCSLPQNFSGEWVNTANNDADVFINETHIIETWHPDDVRKRTTIYVCREYRGPYYMMARLAVDGCQMDYVCYEFVPRHHNIIRYKRSRALIEDNFDTLCSPSRFPKKDGKYDIIVSKTPLPVKCPVAGKFNFTQKGDTLFTNRIFGGVTLSPRPKIACKNVVSDFAVCDHGQKLITIDEKYCLDLNNRAQPVDIYSEPDYQLQCIGYWKENSKSYLITYDLNDAASKYRCWVYQRADINRVLMSLSLGSFCDPTQDALSYGHTHSTAVAIDMLEYEREHDDCPMYFDEGTNPWSLSESINVLTFDHSQTLIISSSLLSIGVLFTTLL